MEKKDLCSQIREQHPDWSDEQVMTAVSLSLQTDATIEQRGKDIDCNDPDIIEEIIIGARNWLQNVLPQIFEKVKQFFNTLLDTIKQWVTKGINYVLNLVDTFFK